MYERTFELSGSEYPQLDTAERIMAALKALWLCAESWHRLFEEWALLNFETLDVAAMRKHTEEIKTQVCLFVWQPHLH